MMMGSARNSNSLVIIWSRVLCTVDRKLLLYIPLLLGANVAIYVHYRNRNLQCKVDFRGPHGIPYWNGPLMNGILSVGTRKNSSGINARSSDGLFWNGTTKTGMNSMTNTRDWNESERLANLDLRTGRDMDVSLGLGLGVVLFWTDSFLWNIISRTEVTLRYFNCGQRNHCLLTNNTQFLHSADAVIFHAFKDARRGSMQFPAFRSQRQRWILSLRRSPVYITIPEYFNGKINWTLSYDNHADISLKWGFYIRHGQYDKLPFYFLGWDHPYIVGLNQSYYSQLEDYKEIKRNTKTRQVLWLVSHCHQHSRDQYADALKRYGISIDVYGKCGTPDPCNKNSTCVRHMAKAYKFYLAFENSLCEDYISEKAWNALGNTMVPIVMGPAMREYVKTLPPDSFLHVDNFTSPRDLATYIRYLDANPTAYNRYHAWRDQYSVVLMQKSNMFLWVCDMCHKMRSDPPKQARSNIATWWNSQDMCRI